MMNKAIAAAIILATASAVPVTTTGGGVTVGAGATLNVATFDNAGINLPLPNLAIPYQGLQFTGITPLSLPKIDTNPKQIIPLPASGSGVGSFPQIKLPVALPGLPTLPTLASLSSTYPGSPYQSFDLKSLSFACGSKVPVVARACTLNVKGYTDDAGKKLAGIQSFIFKGVPTVGGGAGVGTGNTVPMTVATLSDAFKGVKRVTMEITNTAGQVLADLGMIDGVTYYLNPTVSGSTPRS